MRMRTPYLLAMVLITTVALSGLCGYAVAEKRTPEFSTTPDGR